MKIVNLTQHNPTLEQVEAGVGIPLLKEIGQLELLNFDTLEEALTAGLRAIQVAEVVETHCEPGSRVMIGGAPFFMTHLVRELQAKGFMPIFAFSVRDSVDQQMPDGSTKKVSVFRHSGFVEA